MTRQRGWRLLIKRAFDCVAAAVLLVFLWPLLLLTAILLFLSDGLPVIFTQERPGFHGRIFRVHKFRTMRAALDASGRPLPDAQRITRAGKFVRSWSLDELPQLIDVLSGHLSFVGPRPLLVQYLGRYTPEQARRHDVMPGITGWAQINGRNAISWDEKFALDVWYVDHWSLLLDFKILLATASRVLTRHGISQAGEATMQEFMGSAKDDRVSS